VPTPPQRSRISLLLVLVVFCAVCFVVPRIFYSFRVAVLEMRYFGLFALVCVLFIWALIKLGPDNRS